MYTKCLSLPVGTYNDERAKLYELNVTQTELGGSIMETNPSEAEEASKYNTELMMGWFQFVQTEDGSIPATYYSREENQEIVNTKKAIVSAFQANFLGTTTKEEADPQSMHMAEYRYVMHLSGCLFLLGTRTRLGPANSQSAVAPRKRTRGSPTLGNNFLCGSNLRA